MATVHRRFVITALVSVMLFGVVDGVVADDAATSATNSRFLFTSRGKIGLADSDGNSVRYLPVEAPGQATWQPGPLFPDGRRVILLSMEPRRDGPGRPFSEYYHQTPTHLWTYNLDSGTLDEVCQRDRIAPFTTPALLLSNGRLLVQVVKNAAGQIYSVNLDGSDPREFTKLGDGMPYGFSLSPDGTRVAFHLASPSGYQVFTSNIDGTNRVRVAGSPGHLYFGTEWSPDGQWVLYLDCHEGGDPGHDWADLCIGRPDGSLHRVLTTGQSMWFAASYGGLKTSGNGSNLPAWTKQGEILFPQRQEGSKVPWRYRVGQKDVDHFNREFQPEESRGATRIATMNIETGAINPVTEFETAQWDFRASQSADGQKIVFCRARTGDAPAIWVVDIARKKPPRLITQGIEDLGADHPRWLP